MLLETLKPMRDTDFCEHHRKWHRAYFTDVSYRPETLVQTCPCCRDFDFTRKDAPMRDRHWSDETTPDIGHGHDELTAKEQARVAVGLPPCPRDSYWARARLDDPCASAAVLQEARQIIAAERARLEGYANTASYDSPDQFAD